MTIRRPNVRSRCFQPNLQARYPGNRKYWSRPHRIYVKQCRWCHRPKQWLPAIAYPKLCDGCDRWLREFEWSATILIDEPGNYEIKRILAGYRSQDDD